MIANFILVSSLFLISGIQALAKHTRTHSTKLLVFYGEDIILPCPDTTKITSFIWKHGNDQYPEIVFIHMDGRENTELQHPSYSGRVSLVNSAVDDNDASLLLRRATWMDEGVYICTRYYNDALLDICEVELELQIVKAKVRYGEDIVLQCQGSFNKKDLTLTWKKTDLMPSEVLVYQYGPEKTEDQNPSYRGRVRLVSSDMEDGDASLLLSTATWTDNGTYICTVSNSNGQTMNICEVELRVTPSAKIVSVQYGRNIVLPCQESLRKRVSELTWKRLDLQQEYVFKYRYGREDPELQNPSYKGRVSLMRRDVKDGDASLLLRRVTLKDNATYFCTLYSGNSKGGICVVFLKVSLSGTTPQKVSPNNRNTYLSIVLIVVSCSLLICSCWHKLRRRLKAKLLTYLLTNEL